MDIDGKPVEAELLSAEKARRIYEDIVRSLKDPALLEYAGQDLIRVRIFPIEPNGKKRVTLKYTQVLKADDGLVGYVLPLTTEKYSAKPVKKVLDQSRSRNQTPAQIRLFPQPHRRNQTPGQHQSHRHLRKRRPSRRTPISRSISPPKKTRSA